MNSQATIQPASRRARAGMLSMAAVLVAGALGGCSSSDEGALDEFVGTWAIDRNMDTRLTLSCPFALGSAGEIPPNTPLDVIPLWNTVIMERGVLSDLVESAGPCPFFFDVADKVASVLTPDPYSGEAPICPLELGETPGELVLEIQPTDLKLSLLAPVKGEAPKAQFIGVARVPWLESGVAAQEGPCVYAVHLDLHKIAKN